ncbi:substrate-binding domain-containing protein [Agromyces sp. CFH 90414]|uniref:Substrate-binding domain-containing protein n=1 Tax=Agromyces agglutinans TaxID=2662258 RepID=A0A6I2FGK8_9MICO|nr:multiple monosaccharide ABC transporter substrate-binding protein [Agromyces agglutinans]MRG61800.1 substrate-binding domain-containing protein [Agromyces agglutinans]
MLALAACSGGSGGEGGEGGGGLIGVAMPTKSSERWIQDGDAVKEQLEEQGFKVDLQYAEDDIPTQVSQIENMITKGAEALIIASIDGTTLSEVLQSAADSDIPVIAYDRLIRDSENVDYYASFDNFVVGQQQAWSLTNGLGLTDLEGNPAEGAPAGPFNIELFAGSPDDNNATFFWNGAMDVLEPLIEDGTLVVKSGQTDFEQAAILRWDGEVAQSRMEDLLTADYSDGSQVDAVLSPYDGLSRGIISALTDAGYAVGAEWPIISGQDAELDSVKAINSGEQFATIFKDTRKLAEVAVNMAAAILNDEEVEVNNETDYDNGVKVVPSYLLESQIVVKDNITEVLVDSGYWTEEEING